MIRSSQKSLLIPSSHSLYTHKTKHKRKPATEFLLKIFKNPKSNNSIILNPIIITKHTITNNKS
jgi:hypothetical protein